MPANGRARRAVSFGTDTSWGYLLELPARGGHLVDVEVSGLGVLDGAARAEGAVEITDPRLQGLEGNRRKQRDVVDLVEHDLLHPDDQLVDLLLVGLRPRLDEEA